MANKVSVAPPKNAGGAPRGGRGAVPHRATTTPTRPYPLTRGNALRLPRRVSHSAPPMTRDDGDGVLLPRPVGWGECACRAWEAEGEGQTGGMGIQSKPAATRPPRGPYLSAAALSRVSGSGTLRCPGSGAPAAPANTRGRDFLGTIHPRGASRCHGALGRNSHLVSGGWGRI